MRHWLIGLLLLTAPSAFAQQAVPSVPFDSAPTRVRASLRVTTIPLAPPSLAGSSDRPGDSDGPSGHRRRVSALALGASLFGLAPCGVLPATRVTTGAVRSYRTFSPLPAFARRRAVYFLCHFPSGCPDRALPGALPCGVRTFLPASARARHACARFGEASARRSSGPLRRNLNPSRFLTRPRPV